MSQLRLKTFASSLALSGSLAAIRLAFPAVAQAQTTAWSDICVDANNPDVATLQGIQCALGNFLVVALPLIGITAFVMAIAGVVMWQTSGGNSQKVEKGHKTILYAFYALIVALSPFVILNLISSFTGVTSILKFVIPDSNTQWN